jgi:hypothetical protein
MEVFIETVGRLVQGDVFVPQTKDMSGNELSTPRYFFAVAYDKNSAEVNQKYTEIKEFAKTSYPGGETNRPDFAWKIVDGDTQSDKEGFAGCWVFKFSQGFQSKVISNGVEIIDPKKVKRGDYIRVVFNVAPNNSKQSPGIYLNHKCIEFVGAGEEIVAGTDSRELFSSVPAQLPTGATPLATGGATTTTASSPPPPPVPEVLSPPKQMTAGAAGVPYEAFINKGWTDQQLIDAGKMLP